MFHESGHAADPHMTAYQNWRIKASGAYESAIKAQRAEEARKRGLGLGKGVLDTEIRANKVVLAQIQKHGTPQEVTQWKKIATGQIRKGYQAPIFKAIMENLGKKDRNLTYGKEVVKQVPYLRKKYIGLAARLETLFLGTTPKRIEFGTGDRILRGLVGESTEGLSTGQVGGALAAASGLGALIGAYRAKKRKESVLGGAIKGSVGAIF
jgi:hypothetical protein